MLGLESAFAALGVWTLVLIIGSLTTTFGFIVLLRIHERTKCSRVRGLKALSGSKAAIQGLKTLTSELKDPARSPSGPKGGDEVTQQDEKTDQEPLGEKEGVIEEQELSEDECLVETEQLSEESESSEVKEWPFLLPPRRKGDLRRLTVVLDLDETLVRSCEEDTVPIELEFAAAIGALQMIKIQCEDASGGPPERIMTFLRPGVFQFLRQVSSFAEVVVFTAGDFEYASPLVAYLDPESSTFDGSLYRDSTVQTVFHDHVKDLSYLGRDPRYTVLVDNNPFSFLCQPDNGILCQSFYGDPMDQHLLQEVLPMLKLLTYVNDVRPFLRQRYNIAARCQALLINQMAVLAQQN
eukprot:g7248.t1